MRYAVILVESLTHQLEVDADSPEIALGTARALRDLTNPTHQLEISAIAIQLGADSSVEVINAHVQETEGDPARS